MFFAYNIMTATESHNGFAILKLLQSYLELHMYMSLSLHSESTIKAGEAALIDFERVLQVC
jgi:hypothetical protein